MPDFTSKTGPCSNCKINTRYILQRQLFANGSEHFLWVCSRCNRRNPAGVGVSFYLDAALVRKHITPAQIEHLPLIMPDFNIRCVRCGNRTAELHHWAPKGIFGNDETEQWPKDYLCKDCHDQWHRLVTPQLVQQEARHATQ